MQAAVEQVIEEATGVEVNADLSDDDFDDESEFDDESDGDDYDSYDDQDDED